jgi:hypothetical protein
LWQAREVLKEKKDYSRGSFRHARVLVLAVDIQGWFCPPYSNPRKLIALIIPATVDDTWEHSLSIGLLFLSGKFPGALYR